MIVLRGIVFLFVLLGPLAAQAQNSAEDRHLYFLEQRRPGANGFTLHDKAMLENPEFIPPAEPYIRKVEFLVIEPPRTLKDRIDRLLHGVYTDTPPEYDHYGYEMRRYMAHVAGPDVLGDPARLGEELKNIHKAQIILDYWRKEFRKETGEIETALTEDSEAAEKLRATFKYNQSIVNAFLTECQSWLNNNEAVLKFLLEKQGAYIYEDPIFSFRDNEDRLKFLSLYKARIEAHKHITEYAPFMTMVY